jgi:hypothetical protein
MSFLCLGGKDFLRLGKTGWILSKLRNSSKNMVKLRRGNDRESLDMRLALLGNRYTGRSELKS